MKKEIYTPSRMNTVDNEPFDVTELIDLFVELNFSSIHNKTQLYQFKWVSRKIGFSDKVINQVIELGLKEYENLITNYR